MKDKKPKFRLINVREETYQAIRKIAYKRNKPMAAIVNEIVAEKVGK